MRIFCILFIRSGHVRGGFFLPFCESKFAAHKYVLYICGNKSKEYMQTITFYMPVEIPTGHPTFEQQARWIGRAIITQDVDYDYGDEPFTVDQAEITDLFFVPYAGADIKTAMRVEIPFGSKSGYTFLYKLQQAAITAYHNPKLQPAEMPDEI